MDHHELKQKKYYDSIARDYERHFSSSSALYYRHRIYDEFLRDQDFTGKDILDAMCGGGQSSLFFQRHGANITAIDISEGQCENYQSRFPDSKVHCGSILDSGFRDEAFDFIITDSLHHVHPNVNQCMAEFSRLLKPGGRLMLWEPSGGSVMDLARKIWYRADSKYFEENEASIDLDRLVANTKEFNLVSAQYGGGIAYLLSAMSMHLRIPPETMFKLRKQLFWLEKASAFSRLKLFAMWFLVLLEKRA